jgi:capsid protein
MRDLRLVLPPHGSKPTKRSTDSTPTDGAEWGALLTMPPRRPAKLRIGTPTHTAPTRRSFPELRDINARARASVRNDWAARSIVGGYRRHVVGTGITCRSDARDPATGEFLHDFNRALDEAWCAWADNPARCDIEGRKTLVEIQGMMIDEWVTVGESFLVEHWAQGGLLAPSARTGTTGLDV